MAPVLKRRRKLIFRIQKDPGAYSRVALVDHQTPHDKPSNDESKHESDHGTTVDPLNDGGKDA